MSLASWSTAARSTAVNAAMAVPSRRFRQLFARRVLAWTMGDDVHLGRGLRLQNARGLTLGDRVVINSNVSLDLRGGLAIGNDVAIASGTTILTADHDPDSATRRYRARRVTIGDRAWVASNVLLLPGCTVGEGAVVGAGAVASGRLEPWTIYTGNPARPVRSRSHEAQLRLDAWLPPLS
jgi:acetyltransferase-like isoleucine patch superfamily enzyme